MMFMVVMALIGWARGIGGLGSIAVAFGRISSGSQELIPFFREYRDIKKRSAVTYTEYKHVERANGDFGRIFQMAIAYPLSPFYFAYAYFLSPLLTKTPWAWKGWPSVFDTEEDMFKRWDIQNARAIDMFAKGVHLVNSMSSPEIPSGQSLASVRDKIQEFLGARDAWDALDIVDDWVYVDTKPSKKNNPPKAKVGKVPSIVVRDCVRALGSEGVPNIPFLNQLNRNELANMIKKIKDSDDFLDATDLKRMTKREVEEACRERLIPVVKRSDSELRRDLNTWLDVTCTPQDSVVGKYSNEQNRRLVMLGYFVSKDFKTNPKSELYRSIAK